VVQFGQHYSNSNRVENLGELGQSDYDPTCLKAEFNSQFNHLTARRVCPLSGGKAALERQQPLRISLHPDAAREERPQKIPFTSKKSQPCF
jgi:hypothetical protein